MKAASLYKARVKSYAKVAPPAADAPGNASPQPSAVTADRLGDSTARDVSFFSGGGIAINPANKGKFTAKANKGGMGVQAYASRILAAPKGKFDPTLRKEANFARNAKSFQH